MYQERIQRVLSAMNEHSLTQLLVCDPKSIWYLTGYEVEPLERLLVLCLRSDGRHTLYLNRLFPVPEEGWDVVWFTDTDDSLTLLAEGLDRSAPLGIDKEWPARFLLPLMDRCQQGKGIVGVGEPDHLPALLRDGEQAVEIQGVMAVGPQAEDQKPLQGLHLIAGTPNKR